MKSWRKRLAAHLPAALAAPETRGQRRLRLSIVAALTVLGSICLFWDALLVVLGMVAVALVSGLVVYLVVATPFWLIAKSRADDAWLLAERDE